MKTNRCQSNLGAQMVIRDGTSSSKDLMIQISESIVREADILRMRIGIMWQDALMS